MRNSATPVDVFPFFFKYVHYFGGTISAVQKIKLYELVESFLKLHYINQFTLVTFF